MLSLTLFLAFALFFYSVICGDFPETAGIKNILSRYVLSLTTMLGIFILTTFFFGTPLAAIPWAVLGWFLPDWIIEALKNREHSKLKMLSKDIITTAAGLFSSGQMTSDVVKSMAKRFPEPFHSEFQNMIRIWNMNPSASFPRMFNELGHRYGLGEFKAFSTILASSERTGGPAAASKGLKRLGQALRQRDRQIMERNKAMMESKMAAMVAVFILIAGLVLDGTLFSQFFADTKGKLVITASSSVVIGLIFIIKKTMKSEDLE